MQETAVRKEFERSDITLLPRSTGGAARAQTPCNCSAARPVSCHICNSFEAWSCNLARARRSPPALPRSAVNAMGVSSINCCSRPTALIFDKPGYVGDTWAYSVSL